MNKRSVFIWSLAYGFSASVALAQNPPTGVVIPPPFVETARAASDMPKYLRINVKGYHIRTSPDFRARTNDNIDFKTSRGATFAVRRTIKMRAGVAANILVNGEDRWVYVPNWRKKDFEFCDSEACFSDLAKVLKILSNQNITPDTLAECGLALNPDGSMVSPDLPTAVTDAPMPAPLPIEIARENERRIPAEKRVEVPTRLKTKPLWESARSGASWTKMLVESLKEHGKGLLAITKLEDQSYFCPAYPKLSKAEREEFWVHLFNGIAKYESSFKASTTFDEKTRRNLRSGPINPHTHSQGLFQLSYGSAAQKPYRNFCKFDFRRDRNKDLSDPSLTIYDPKKQMDCAVGIMNKWVSKDRSLGLSVRGGARFWSTLRSTNPATAGVRASLKRFSPCWR